MKCPECESNNIKPDGEKYYRCLDCDTLIDFIGHNLKTRLKSEIDKIQVPFDYKNIINNILLLSFSENIRLLEQQVRHEQFDDAMHTAAEIAVKMAIYADRGRI